MRQAETRTFWTATSTWVPFSDLMVWGANWKEQIKTILFLHSTPGQQQQMSCALIVPFTSRMLELSRSSYYFNVENSKEACKHKSWWDIWKSRMWIQIWFAIADYCYLCFVLFFFFWVRVCLNIWWRLAWNSQAFCLNFPCAGITSVHEHIQLLLFFFYTLLPWILKIFLEPVLLP